MSKEDGGYWLPIHPGLLDDEDWAGLSAAERGAWITLFLLLDRQPRVGWFRDRRRVEWLLERYGGQYRRSVSGLVDGLEAAGWLVAESPDLPTVTIRGWHQYTDEAARKKIYNATRGDRGDRSEEYRQTAERKRAERRRRRRETEGDGGRPRQDETNETSSRRDGGERARETAPWPPFEEMMATGRKLDA